VCGAPAPPPYRVPQPELSPDLDLRPGEPARSSLPNWIITCPQCGAAAPDLAALGPQARAALDTDAYRDPPGPPEALPFLRWAAICRAGGDLKQAAEATLQAAWATDDAADASAGAALRRQVAGLWGEPADARTALRLIDVLRRAGAFDQAEARARALAEAKPERDVRLVVDFQRVRIAARDTGRHLLSSALPGAARGGRPPWDPPAAR
jgi:hypothetical protein